MKKYVLFGCTYPYPEGGMQDIRGSFDTVEEACSFLVKAYQERGTTFYWTGGDCYLVDRDTWEIVKQFKLLEQADDDYEEDLREAMKEHGKDQSFMVLSY